VVRLELPHGDAGMRGAGYPYALPMRLIDDGVLLFSSHGGFARIPAAYTLMKSAPGAQHTGATSMDGCDRVGDAIPDHTRMRLLPRRCGDTTRENIKMVRLGTRRPPATRGDRSKTSERRLGGGYVKRRQCAPKFIKVRE
jgi:hypothetical protein